MDSPPAMSRFGRELCRRLPPRSEVPIFIGPVAA